MRQIFESGRIFKIWAYKVSHKQLLLRSNKEDGYGSRIEILFKGVDFIKMETLVRGLSIFLREEGGDGGETDAGTAETSKQFVIKTAGCDGLVVAGALFVDEGDFEFFEESRLLPSQLN